MPLPYSGQPFTLGLQPQTTKPLDVRMVIGTASDRLLPDTWKVGVNYYVYPGMFTVCKDSGLLYVYIGKENDNADVADSTKWKKVGMDNSDGTYVTMDQLRIMLSSYVTSSLLNSKLSTYALKETFENYVSSAESTFAKLTDLPIIDTELNESSVNPVQNKTVTREIRKQSGNITALSSLVKELTDNGIGGLYEYNLAFLEETSVENLTVEAMSEGVVYIGLEPYESESGEGGGGTSSTVVYAQGYADVSDAVRDNGYVKIARATADVGYVKI